MELLDTEIEIADRPGARPAPGLRGDVRFEGVSFAYEPGARLALVDRDLAVATGTPVALVLQESVLFGVSVRDTPIIVLDEATTGLDECNEREVSEALRRVSEGRTSFLIAHALHTVQDADLILYMDDGRVIERGTHGELMTPVSTASQADRAARRRRVVGSTSGRVGTRPGRVRSRRSSRTAIV